MSNHHTVKQYDEWLVSGYIRNILNHRESSTIPKELILICVSYIEAKGIDFIHSSNFDKNGICHAFATDFGRRSWANPMDQRLIHVTAAWNCGCGQNIFKGKTKRDISLNYTRNNKNGSIEIDFKSQLIVPTAYSWRHDKRAGDYPHNWNFEGSADGKKWSILSKHKNDSQHGIDGAYTSHTWMIAPRSSLTCYRIFRFRLTGKAASVTTRDTPHTIHCAGFEIYGRLIHISSQHKAEYQRIITAREIKRKEEQLAEQASQERREKCEPILWILLAIFALIFVFVPDIFGFIIGATNDCTSNSGLAIGVNLYLKLGGVLHFAAIGICIACLSMIIHLAEPFNYWDDDKIACAVPSAVCCVGLWTASWSVVGCILYSKMDKTNVTNKVCSDMVISWSVLKILESFIAMPFVLYMWIVLHGFATYDYE